MTFVLVTGNPGKAAETERILGFRPDIQSVDLPEIQSLNLLEVLEAKAREAWRRLRDAGRRGPVVVEETGLELSAMNGFPGPLVKWMLEAVGAEGVARAGLALGDPGVAAVCGLAYFDRPKIDRATTGRADLESDEELLLVAVGRADGVLTLPPRGEHGFGWDPVFVPEGETLTYAELSSERKDEIGHRGRAWRKFRDVLRQAGRLE